MSHDAKSLDIYHEITPVYVKICPGIISSEKKQKQVGEKPAPEFTNSLYCEIKKLITNAAPKRTKK